MPFRGAFRIWQVRKLHRATVASPTKLMRSGGFREAGSFRKKSPEAQSVRMPIPHTMALPSLCVAPAAAAVAAAAAAAPPSPPPPPDIHSPQPHVLNVLDTCMMLELGNRCTVLVAAVPAPLRCLLSPTPAHAPFLHQPHDVAGHVRTHNAFPQPHGQPPHERAAQCGAMRAQELLLA